MPVAAENTIKNKIVVEGEKEYKNSLDQIRRSLAETKSEMREAKTAFAGQEESAQSLRAQIDILTRQYAANESQCRTLEAYLEKTSEAFGSNSREASDLRIKLNNARAAMNMTGTELSTLQKRLDGVEESATDAGGGFDAVGESAQRAQEDVEALSESIADAIGQKTIDFVIGGAALNALKDGLASAIEFGFTEGMNGLEESGLMTALTGDAELAAQRLAVKDEIDKLWGGRMDGLATTSLIATVDTSMGNIAGIDPELLEQVSNYVALLQEAFGQDALDSMERAKTLVTTFGEEWVRVFDLMTKGYQDSADGGAAMNEMIDKSAQLFNQMGYDADDMFSVILAAVNNEELGKDSNLAKGMQSLIDTVTSGSKEAKETLQALGLEATDIGYKAQQGGETAAAAYKLVLEQLMAIDDVDLRNKLGSEIFGESVWLNTGGDVATALLAGFDQTIQADGTAQSAMDALLDNLGDNFAGFKERIGQSAEKTFEPLVAAANDALKRINDEIDEAGGSITAGICNAITGAVQETFEVNAGVEQARAWGAAAGQAWGEGYAEEVAKAIGSGEAEVVTEPPVIDDLLEAHSRAAGEGNEELAAALQAQIDDAASAAVEAAKNGQQTLTIDDLFAARAQAAGEGNEALVAELDAQIEETIAAASAKAQEGTQDAAQEVADALEQAGPEIHRAGESCGQEAVDGLESAEGDAREAGDLVGSAGMDGLTDGLGDGYDIGSNYGSAVASGIRSRLSAVRAAANALGSAASGGTKSSLQIASPSKVGLATGENYGESVAEGIRRREATVAAAGALLGDAANAGTREQADGLTTASSLTGTAAAQGEALDGEAMADAFARGMSGLALQIDGRTAGRLLETYVSIAGYDRAAATVSGRSASRRI